LKPHAADKEKKEGLIATDELKVGVASRSQAGEGDGPTERSAGGTELILDTQEGRTRVLTNQKKNLRIASLK